MNIPFAQSSDSPRLILRDNPGYDEYGSSRVTKNAEKSYAASAAFIFVTAMDDYTKKSSSEKLKKIYEEDKGNIILC